MENEAFIIGTGILVAAMLFMLIMDIFRMKRQQREFEALMKQWDYMDKLHAIEERKIIYDIHYCKAGVGFLFYNPPVKSKAHKHGELPKSWRQYLKVSRYYPTFEEAVNAEYEIAKKL